MSTLITRIVELKDSNGKWQDAKHYIDSPEGSNNKLTLLNGWNDENYVIEDLLYNWTWLYVNTYVYDHFPDDASDATKDYIDSLENMYNVYFCYLSDLCKYEEECVQNLYKELDNICQQSTVAYLDKLSHDIVNLANNLASPDKAKPKKEKRTINNFSESIRNTVEHNLDKISVINNEITIASRLARDIDYFAKYSNIRIIYILT